MSTRRPSSSQYRKTSRDVKRATLDMHVSAPPPSFSSRKGFSNPRRARTALRGEIHQVLPNTTTRESRRAYESRVNQRAYMERSVATSRRRKALLIGALALVVVIVAVLASIFVFTGGVNGRMVISDSAVKAALADAPEDETGTYTLLAASYDDGDSGTDPDVLVLMRTDAEAGNASALVIPGNASVRLSDGNVYRIGEARALGGDAELIKAAESIVGVNIGHFITTDTAGFEALVDALGGVEATLPEDIKDADAGTFTLKAGTQTLSGEQALFACRADDYLSSADQVRGQVIGSVAAGLFAKLSQLNMTDFYTSMDTWASYLKTDMDVEAAWKLLDGLRGINPSATKIGVLPTCLSEVDGVQYQVVMADDTADMVARMKTGADLTADKADVINAVDPASFTITVNNGGTVEGAAGDASSILKEAGFNVVSVGNAAQAVYDETLIIYADSEKNEKNAEALVATLGIGRAVWDSVHYAFDTDILIVVGNDWQALLDARSEQGE